MIVATFPSMLSRGLSLFLVLLAMLSPMATAFRAVDEAVKTAATRDGCCGPACQCGDRCPCIQRQEHGDPVSSQPLSPPVPRDQNTLHFSVHERIDFTVAAWTLSAQTVRSLHSTDFPHDRSGRVILALVSRWTT